MLKNDAYSPIDENNWKRVYNEGHLHFWRSFEMQTPFAPNLNLPFWLDDVSHHDIKSVIDVELSNFCTNDLWESYNIFDWKHPCIQNLKTQICKSHANFLSALGLPDEEVWIRGWAQVLNIGEGVEPHTHSHHENTYLSGNISLSEGTVTEYEIPYLSPVFGSWKVQNIPGRVTLFPSWVQHYVQPVNEKRYSIGFDLFNRKTFDFIDKTKQNSKPQDIILLSIPL